MTYDKTNAPTESVRERGAIMAAMVKKGWTPVYVGPVFPGDECMVETAVVISLMPEEGRWWKGMEAYQVHTAAKTEAEGWIFTWGRYDLDAKKALMYASEKTPAKMEYE